MIYKIRFEDNVKDEIIRLKRSEPQAFKKLTKLLAEIQKTPTSGTGKPELLCGDKAGLWSRRINKKHRLVYKVLETEIIILILSVYGHYDDK